jgi:ATP-dependent RNA helicase DeaD
LNDNIEQDEPGTAPEESADDSSHSPYAQVSPDQIIEPENAIPEAKLEDLPESIQDCAKRMGWTSLTPVQAKAMPYMVERRDLMVQSRTGSGKTGAFLLPVLAELDPDHPYCQALILVPTRELAVQVQREAEILGAQSGIRSVAVYGGVGYGSQLEAFKQGAHLVIGTPGRILDHLMKHSLDLDDLEFMVFDEADRMMSMGFYPDMKAIRKYLPSRRSGFMFSATFPANVQGLAREFLSEPAFLSLSHGNVHIAGMDHIYYEVPGMEKDRVLARIIEQENPPAAIIFCNTKQRVAYITAVLQRFGYDADQLTADLSQRDRERVLDRVRKKNLRFLVATDVAARGIDISHLTHVFLYEFPDDLESYIHRAGRTGRAGASGVCISLVSYQELAELHLVSKRFGIEMEKREIPSEEDVANLVAERTTALLEQKLRQKDRIEKERMERFLPLARALTASDGEPDVVAMLLDEYYHASLHAPAEVPGEPEDQAKPAAPQHQRSHKPHTGDRSSSGGGGEKSGGGQSQRRRRRPGGKKQ